MFKVAQGWRQLLDEALIRHEHLPQSRFAALATVRPDGRPANRTVTFRSFISRDRLLFSADARSEKLSHIERQPWVELCWYFPESRQQFRLAGRIDADAAREPEVAAACLRLWQERPEHFRQSFTWPQPGHPRAIDAAFQIAAPDAPPENFLILVLEPESVEVLDLRAHPHERRLFDRVAGSWKEVRLNP